MGHIINHNKNKKRELVEETLEEYGLITKEQKESKRLNRARK